MRTSTRCAMASGKRETAKGFTALPSTAISWPCNAPRSTHRLVAAAALINRNRTTPPLSTATISGSSNVRSLARMASNAISELIAMPAIFITGIFDLTIFMCIAWTPPPPCNSARTSAGSRNVKSCSITTCSCSSKTGLAVSYTISGAANNCCSCNPKCECIQCVPTRLLAN